MELYRFKQVGFQYPAGQEAVLKDISMKIDSGEFIVLCGNSGCGKTTLLRLMKTAIAPHGKQWGDIRFHGRLLEQVEGREQAGRIGYVGQNPEDLIVTDKVWHELAFGLESLGLEQAVIRRRVAEMSHFLGIQEWFHQDTAQLSGGQKQIVNLASVMVMQPEILLLDEPTSQLDPVAAAEFMTVLERIHRELGTAIFMTGHRLEEVLSYCSRLLVLDQGVLQYDGPPTDMAEKLREQGEELSASLPAQVRIWMALEEGETPCPMSIQEGRDWFTGWRQEQGADLRREEEPEERKEKPKGEKSACTLWLKDVWFRYEKKGADILQGVSLQAYAGELLVILGGNGSGKSTLLSLISGSIRPQRGTIRFPGGRRRLVCLPQNPQILFLEDTVQKELKDMDRMGTGERLTWAVRQCKLDNLLDRHPYDLSGGEQQRLALAKVLLADPEILLLDEPTKGLDFQYKRELAEILKNLLSQGLTILMVSHDVEFCGEYANRCMLMFDGQITAGDTPERFFSENYFYTTSANRMVRHILPQAITVEQVLRQCRKEVKSCEKGDWKGADGEDGEEPRRETDGGGGEELRRNIKYDAENADAAIKAGKSIYPASVISGIVIALLAIPVTIYIGTVFLKDEKYLFISLLILLECMLPFFLTFEGKKPPAGDLVILSALCAIGVAGRAVFAAFPNFKPVTAVTIIAGAAYGGEAGFLVGAVTMLISNMLMSQGPWTPWQMFAMGSIGFLAGLLFHRRSGSCRGGKAYLLLLCIYGFLSVIFIYGGIMNLFTAVIAGTPIAWKALLPFYISGFPFDLIHGAATVLFLLLGAKPLLGKLERIKVKYG